MSSCTICEQHTESTFRIEGMCCHTEAKTLEQRLGRLTGIHRLSTDVVGQRLRVAYDAAKTTSSTIAEAVADQGRAHLFHGVRRDLLQVANLVTSLRGPASLGGCLERRNLRLLNI